MSHKTEHVGHWKDLETWLSVATDSLLPKAAETLKVINRLIETLAATTQKMEQIKEDYADRSVKLQYTEQLLEKAKADFRDKNSRIKALEAHLNESRNEISRLT